ncbi:PrsW family intramembrane metalloprotease [Microbacterium amylolyticum]|uniref:RsiW-degrading membrane proteinase PrsW (M82 family) n=1 Tax=Microbacterium amylolyticum TaxID=936337 RepID=A0ABS4ZFX9_9MICO|nr:PrsW family intramembrane metalloprotease [Microbacterium amylolyticum]MBP2436174.1 RsiW-degrading membrane proteinase PrsW (M82 family) [Microbacterium amylolyticum]
MATPHERADDANAHPAQFAQAAPGSAATILPAPAAEPHIRVARRREPTLVKQGRAVWPWFWAVIALFGLATVSYFFALYGAALSIFASLLALIPFVLVVVFLVWLDRWEPEPRGMLLFAVLWGGFVAVALTLFFGNAISLAWPATNASAAFGPVVRAPIVEEVVKCAGVLLLLAMGRRTFDGATDGIVYGGLIGAGFAFIENVKYFVEALLLGGVEHLSATFFLRGVLSPFAHIMFTAACGFAVGLAVRKNRGVFLPWLAGLGVAIVLHAIWNGAAVYTNFYSLYVVLHVPLFVIFMVGAVRLRWEELRIRRAALEDYVRAGWFAPEEADMLSTRDGRAVALRWAATLPGDRRPLMKHFIHDGARLAWARHRALTGGDPQAAHDEGVLLDRMMRSRAQLLAP